MGLQKCLVIVGVRLDRLENGFTLTLKDLEPLAVKALEHCPGEVIRDTISEVITQTGMPVAVLTDGGAEFKKGLQLLASSNPSVKHLQDITHKLNALLKREMENEVLDGFKRQATQLTQQLKLTPAAHLAPPRQRVKDRLFGIFPLVKWGLRLIFFLESPQGQTLDSIHRQKIEWIMEYRLMLTYWKKLINITQLIKELVLKQGYHRYLVTEVQKHLFQDNFLSEDVQRFFTTVVAFLQEQSQKIPEGLAYPGCTDVIESLFGKFKQLEGAQSAAGFSSLILALPALVGTLTESDVEKVTSTISVNMIRDWVYRNLGRTYANQRRSCLNKHGTSNVKFDLEIPEIIMPVMA